MYCPPFAVSVEPVIRPASSEARNTTQRPISSGSPSRPIGVVGRMLFLQHMLRHRLRRERGPDRSRIERIAPRGLPMASDLMHRMPAIA